MCDMTHSCFYTTHHLYKTWRIHVCGITQIVVGAGRLCYLTPYDHVWHDWFKCATWLILIWDMAHSHVWHDSGRVAATSPSMFICATWLFHVCDMTGFYETWLMPECGNTFFDGYCSTVQDLLDWFEVDLGFTELSFIQIDLCVTWLVSTRRGPCLCVTTYVWQLCVTTYVWQLCMTTYVWQLCVTIMCDN